MDAGKEQCLFSDIGQITQMALSLGQADTESCNCLGWSWPSRSSRSRKHVPGRQLHPSII